MRTLVLGIGNLLMGDEGVGVHVVRLLQGLPPVPGVELADGGTGGLHLLGYFLDFNRIILVDAVQDGNRPGTIRTLRPKFSADYPRTLTAHDIGLKDVLDAVAILERKPEIILITVSVGDVDRPSLELTPAVRASIEPAAAAVRAEIFSSSP